jgi:hemolysin activation/secretion protein
MAMARTGHGCGGHCHAGRATSIIVKPLQPLLHRVLALWVLVLVASSQAWAAEPTFDILAYEIEGNTVLPADKVEAAVLPFMGPQRSMKDVEAARTALEQLYQQGGYLTVLVDIPEQRITEGVVRLAVLEGRVGGLYVMGSRYHSQGWIRSRVPELASGEVPDFNRVQQQLAGLNRSNDRQVQPVLRPGRLPGTVDVDLQVRDSLPLSASVELHNNHSHDTDEARASATLRYDNFLQRDHAISLTFLTAPREPQQSKVWVFNYTAPLGTGDSLNLSYTHSNSDVETLGSTQVLGGGHTYSLRRQLGWATADGYRSLGYGLDYKNLQEQAALSTPVRYLPFQATFADQWSDRTEQVNWNVGLTAASQHLLQRQVYCPTPQGDAYDDQFNCKRAGASGSFGVIKADARWRHRFTPEQSVALRLAGQVASGPLISAEQYSLGGADSVRGYYESEVNGDNAVLGSFEWQGPGLVKELPLPQALLTPLVFFDIARGYTLLPLAGQASHGSLASTGLGLRLNSRDLDLSLDLASPLHATQYSPRGELRLHARAAARF